MINRMNEYPGLKFNIDSINDSLVSHNGARARYLGSIKPSSESYGQSLFDSGSQKAINIINGNRLFMDTYPVNYTFRNF